MRDDLSYISPELLEYRELTQHEKEVILFSRSNSQEKPFDIAIAFILCIVAVIIDPFKTKFINILLIVTFIIYIIVRSVFDHSSYIRYKSATSGKVFKISDIESDALKPLSAKPDRRNRLILIAALSDYL